MLSRLTLLAPFALAACGQPQPVHSTPPPEWTQPVAEPAVPEGSTDADVADYLIRLREAFMEANARLKRLDDWREGLPR
jgi:hypothetical protein